MAETLLLAGFALALTISLGYVRQVTLKDLVSPRQRPSGHQDPCKEQVFEERRNVAGRLAYDCWNIAPTTCLFFDGLILSSENFRIAWTNQEGLWFYYCLLLLFSVAISFGIVAYDGHIQGKMPLKFDQKTRRYHPSLRAALRTRPISPLIIGFALSLLPAAAWLAIAYQCSESPAGKSPVVEQP